MTDKAERIPAAERREQILAAASAVFGERGYVGATTDQIARVAGISQPYVVRMFGSKEQLFVEVLSRALQKLLAAFRAEIAAGPGVVDGLPLEKRIGKAYVALIADRGILLSLMQAFLMGNDEVIGAKARAGFLQLFELLRDEAGLPAEQAAEFMANGMLLNTLVALQMPQSALVDTVANDLMCAVFPTNFDLVMHVTGAMR